MRSLKKGNDVIIIDRTSFIARELKNEMFEDQFFGKTVRDGHRIMMHIEVAFRLCDAALVRSVSASEKGKRRRRQAYGEGGVEN